MEDGNKKNMNVNEAALVGEAFNNGGVMSSECGLWINKEKYFIVNYNEGTNSIYLKGKGRGGCITKTVQTLLVGVFEGNNSGDANRDVEDLAEKLKGAGY